MCPFKPTSTRITLISEEETGGSSSGISVPVGSSFGVKKFIYKANSLSVAPINAVASLKRRASFFVLEYSYFVVYLPCDLCPVFCLEDDIYLHSSFQ
jgi:hypothetical protein